MHRHGGRRRVNKEEIGDYMRCQQKYRRKILRLTREECEYCHWIIACVYCNGLLVRHIE